MGLEKVDYLVSHASLPIFAWAFPNKSASKSYSEGNCVRLNELVGIHGIGSHRTRVLDIFQTMNELRNLALSHPIFSHHKFRKRNPTRDSKRIVLPVNENFGRQSSNQVGNFSLSLRPQFFHFFISPFGPEKNYVGSSFSEHFSGRPCSLNRSTREGVSFSLFHPPRV